MIRPSSKNLRRFLEAAEGREHKAYQDTNGTWTIGVGHTSVNVHPGLIWSDAQIDAQHDKDVETAIRRLEGVLKPEVILSLNDNQWDALISFVFNLGARKSWTIWKVLNAQAEGWERATVHELNRFVNETAPDGTKRVVAGLTARRAAEAALFLTPDTDSVKAPVAIAAAAPIAPSSGALRDAETPPTQAAPSAQPLAKRPSFLAGIAGLFMGAPALISTILETVLKPVMDAVAPFADRSPQVATAIGWMAAAAAGLVALTVILQALDRQREKN